MSDTSKSSETPEGVAAETSAAPTSQPVDAREISHQFPVAMDAERFVGRNYFEAEMRPHQYWKLRAYHEDLVASLATRLSLHLRMPIELKLNALDTPNYEDFRKRLLTPIHLALVKAEPQDCVCILAIHPTLGLSIADRLMGGPGIAEGPEREMGDIESALLDQAIQLLMSDYFKWIPTTQPLRPNVIAHESHPSFLKKGGPDHRLMVLTLEAGMGEMKHPIEIALPFELVGQLIEQFRMSENPAASATSKTPREFWTEQLQSMPLAIRASWRPLQLRAGEIGRLRVGDVVPVDAEFANHIQLRLGPRTTLHGRLGSVDGRRAVQLTSIPAISPAS